MKNVPQQLVQILFFKFFLALDHVGSFLQMTQKKRLKDQKSNGKWTAQAIKKFEIFL